MNYLRLINGADLPESDAPENDPGAYGARTRNLRRDRAAL